MIPEKWAEKSLPSLPPLPSSCKFIQLWFSWQKSPLQIHSTFWFSWQKSPLPFLPFHEGLGSHHTGRIPKVPILQIHTQIPPI